MSKTYNGWTNYETWNVKLWMDNEEGSYLYWKDIAQECYDDADSCEDDAVQSLRNRLKEEYETNMEDWLDESKRSSSVWADLLGAALSEVNWHEIAQNMIEDVDKNEDE
jgi:hypothetical protein